MKKIHYIWLLMLYTLAIGCQDINEPYNNIPVVQTRNADYVTSTTAHLNYSYETGKANCYYLFQIGMQADLSDAWESENNIITGLTPGTTYYYRVVARGYGSGDKVNEVYGEILSFTTLEGLQIGKVIYTDWDGSAIEWNEAPMGITLISNNGDNFHNLQANVNADGWYLPETNIQPENLRFFYAYWPWVNYGYNNTGYGSIRVQTYKYSGEYYLFASHHFSGDKYLVDINLYHTMARVILHFSIGNDNADDYVGVRNLTISNGYKILPTTGNLDFNEGGYIATTSDSFDFPLAYDNSFEISKGRSYDLILYSIPTTNTGTVELSMRMSDGSVATTQLEVEGWRRGETTEYNLVYTQSTLQVSDVTLDDWIDNDGGNITVND